MSDKYEDNDPAVIAAKAEAHAKVLEARSKLHPIAQIVYTILDETGTILSGLGCLFIIFILVLAIFAPHILTSLIH